MLDCVTGENSLWQHNGTVFVFLHHHALIRRLTHVLRSPGAPRRLSEPWGTCVCVCVLSSLPHNRVCSWKMHLTWLDSFPRCWHSHSRHSSSHLETMCRSFLTLWLTGGPCHLHTWQTCLRYFHVLESRQTICTRRVRFPRDVKHCSKYSHVESWFCRRYRGSERQRERHTDRQVLDQFGGCITGVKLWPCCLLRYFRIGWMWDGKSVGVTTLRVHWQVTRDLMVHSSCIRKSEFLTHHHNAT